MFLLCAYLGWAAFGKLFIGRAPYFWLDPDIVQYRELMFGYCAVFVALGPACKSYLLTQLGGNEDMLTATALIVFAFMYGLIGLREELAEKYGSPSQATTATGSENGDEE